MARRTSPTIALVLLAAFSLVAASCGGPTDAQRIRMAGVHVETRAEPVDAGPPPGTELRLLPRHHDAGDNYRRVDEAYVEVEGHATTVRVERTVTIDGVDREGIISISEKITGYERKVDGHVAPLTREQRDLEAATIRYRVTDLGEPVGELEIVDEGRFNEALLRSLAEMSVTQDPLDRSTDMAVGDRRTADRTVLQELSTGVRAEVHLHVTYALGARTEREARFDLEGTADLAELQIGRNRVRGTGNIAGRWTVDPRDGFAGTSNTELRLYLARRDAGNRPVGESTTYIIRWQTSITKR